MNSLIKKEKIYIKLDDYIDHQYLVAVGINKIQGYSPISFYLNLGQFKNMAIRIKRVIDEDKYCELYYNQTGDKWTGSPYILDIEEIDGIKYINMSSWIYNYAPLILFSAYYFIDIDIELEGVDVVSMNINKLKKLSNGLQLAGYIRNGTIDIVSDYSVDFRMIFHKLPEKPMIGRVGDTRVGYFYDQMYIDTKNNIAGDPIVLINRKNLDNVPWVYVADHSIPKKYHQAVKRGILSWNKIYNNLGLGCPFKVLTYDDEDYPQNIDVFDPKYWYILGTEINQFNGPYSGYSVFVSDYRSGEIVFGLISLNLIKIISNPSRYFDMNQLDSKLIKTEDGMKSTLDKMIEDYLAWITAHEIGHQIGLRHNFMGNLASDGFGSVMDYIDVFNDQKRLELMDIDTVDRDYDIKAIKYGYVPIPDEVTGVKHPMLNQIASEKYAPFGTDENYFEDINPHIGQLENEPDMLYFINKVMPFYKT